MAVTEDQLAELVSKFDLPPLPRIAHALIQMLGDPDVAVQDLAGVISVEPVLASRLIKVANSSMYGQTTVVTTVERAAVVLGVGYV
ncbi:MAG: HDOD domain-containing protein, partial [Planctomycetes bacterium]|nr:HDOD domain-containing protein [Planctomycetota bacterium]